MSITCKGDEPKIRSLFREHVDQPTTHRKSPVFYHKLAAQIRDAGKLLGIALTCPAARGWRKAMGNFEFRRRTLKR